MRYTSLTHFYVVFTLSLATTAVMYLHPTGASCFLVCAGVGTLLLKTAGQSLVWPTFISDAECATSEQCRVHSSSCLSNIHAGNLGHAFVAVKRVWNRSGELKALLEEVVSVNATVSEPVFMRPQSPPPPTTTPPDITLTPYAYGESPAEPSVTPSNAPIIEAITAPTGQAAAEIQKRREVAALDCQLSAWSDWSDCVNSEDANDGMEAYVLKTRQRTRSIVNPQQAGGQPCNITSQVLLCESIEQAEYHALLNSGLGKEDASAMLPVLR